MQVISTIERVRLNYAASTIGFIVLYTFTVATFSAEFLKLWLHSIYFIVAEMIKLVIIQKYYGLDLSYSQEGVRKKRSNKVGDSIKFAVLMIMTIFFYAFICVIMGAPPLTHVEETLTLSSLLTALTIFPISLFIGVSGTLGILFTETFELVNVTSQEYLKLLQRNAYLVIFGAFIGSIAFPLDWDRPWQAYPIPNITGAITGQMLGCFYCFFETMVRYKLGKKYR
ncbi:CLUMA_CG011681, isoform A [Clunio marinus]|uniref:CLUMA_CG011681, isoform A n=1 Tax=Clunio marinus TaxID=568069 RepID=A0A1J1IDF9_9DIPT|nr:CLUMA_CG011681, isoform A [Clunio marinus]